MRPGGRIVIYGGTNGDATIKMFPLFWKHVTIFGTSMGSPQDFAAMLALFEAGLRPVVDRVFALDDVGSGLPTFSGRAISSARSSFASTSSKRLFGFAVAAAVGRRLVSIDRSRMSDRHSVARPEYNRRPLCSASA